MRTEESAKKIYWRKARAAALVLLLSGVAACAKTGEPVAPPTIVVDYGLPLVFFD